MWRRAMDYLGLSGEDVYDDYDMSTEYERPTRAPSRPRVDDSGMRGRPGPPIDEPSYPMPRGPRLDDTGAARRPDDSNLNVRPVGAPRPPVNTGSSVRPTQVSAEPMTVSPIVFNEAQTVADYFKSGTPVIVNFVETDHDVTRRIIDFASGLCYAMNGTMKKVAPNVYLLTPPAPSYNDRY